jgi:poly-gamma-glutamate synthesis protein (capsule biosynthesis protein)
MLCSVALAWENKPTTASETGDDGFSLFIAGDAIITQPWRQIADPAFLEVIRRSREAHVSIVNLETTLGDFTAHPQKESGGTWLMARPQIARELAWAGIDLVGAANNHAYDYGPSGVRTTLESATAAGLAIAGIGPDLQQARRVATIERAQRTVGLASMTATFEDYWAAVPANASVPGRPGLNPLGISFHDNTAIRILTHANRFVFEQLSRYGVAMRGVRLHRFDERDLAGNLEALRSAAPRDDYLVLSIHAHQPGVWLEDFAHQAIDAGVDVFMSHGPHTLAGIEIYRGRPIFYGLGNFVLQYDQVERLPAEAFARVGLPATSSTQDYFSAVDAEEGRGSLNRRPEAWQSVAAVVRFENDRLASIELIPLDLGFRQPMVRRGLPMKAGPELARRIISVLQDQSTVYRTRIEFRSATGTGAVPLTPQSRATSRPKTGSQSR